MTRTHGMTDHPLYRVWNNMIRRCTDSRTPNYHRYGGRGISVCADWHDASVFFKWALANGYIDGLQLDRVNNDGGYTPKNCRFVTREVQARNTRRIMSTNTSGFRGVSWSRKWKAEIMVDGKSIYLGRFDTSTEAAEAYDGYVIANNLEHTLNFPRTGASKW